MDLRRRWSDASCAVVVEKKVWKKKHQASKSIHETKYNKSVSTLIIHHTKQRKRKTKQRIENSKHEGLSKHNLRSHRGSNYHFTFARPAVSSRCVCSYLSSTSISIYDVNLRTERKDCSIIITMVCWVSRRFFVGDEGIGYEKGTPIVWSFDKINVWQGRIWKGLERCTT